MGLRRSKVIKVYAWSVWLDVCKEHNVDPEVDDFGYDLGGGDTETWEFHGNREEG